MPNVTLELNDTAELMTLDRFESLSIRPTGGEIRFAENRADARRGTLIEDEDRRIELALSNNETFYVYADSVNQTGGTIDVEFRKQGFLDIVFPRAEVNVFDTTNYPNVNSTVSSTYPISIDETWTIKEFIVFDAPSDKTLDITAESGQTATAVEPKATSFVLDRIEIDSVDVKDPNGSGGESSLLWSGE